MDEKEILKFWKESKIFEKTLAKDSPSGEFVFTTARRLPPVCLIMAVYWPLSPRMFFAATKPCAVITFAEDGAGIATACPLKT